MKHIIKKYEMLWKDLICDACDFGIIYRKLHQINETKSENSIAVDETYNNKIRNALESFYL